MASDRSEPFQPSLFARAATTSGGETESDDPSGAARESVRPEDGADGARHAGDAGDGPRAADDARPTLIVIDGHALAYRSYYAIRDLSTSQGRPVGAVFGFLRSLLRILDEEDRRDATVVAFDAPAKTFRHEQFEDYKAGRAPTPDDLPEQIATIKRVVDLLGLHRIEVPGLEADDVMGTIARRGAARGYRVELVTSDRDAYQLIDDAVTVRGLDKDDRITAADVEAKYGVRVDQWVDYRALTGDSSDNIPGAKGIGPVSARKLLQAYGDLDTILADLDAVEPASYAAKIRAAVDDVRFSRELSRIVTDADIEVAPDAWADRTMERDALADTLRELEFGSLLHDLGLAESVDFATGAWSDLAGGDGPWIVGAVLSSERATAARLEDLAVAGDEAVATAPDPDARRRFLARGGTWHGVDVKALVVHALTVHGAETDDGLAPRLEFDAPTDGPRGAPPTPGDDPVLMAYVLDPNRADPATVARRYGSGEWGETAAERAAAAAELLARLDGKLDGARRELYETIERPLQGVLARMEARGVAVDTEQLEAQSAALGARLETLEAEVRAVADDPDFNVNSRDQVARLLYDELGLAAGRKTSTGKRSTAVGVLEQLRDEHPVVATILDYRELAKLKSTYLDPLPTLVSERTGRIHTTFAQTVAATGRLSSVGPNLQNIPVRSELGRAIRGAFVAAPGTSLLVADYSQIELRVLAHVSGDPALCDAFRAGEDIHRRTAAEVFDVEPDAVDAERRRVAKVINFGVIYGMSAHRLARELDLAYDEAAAFIERYFERYPGVRRYIDETLAFCREHGWVETFLGRRRPIPDIASPNPNTRGYAERTAYNMPIQGAAADLMKMAMLHLDRALAGSGGQLILQVHDEVVIEAPHDEALGLAATVREVMESVHPLKVPLVAEVGVGPTWLDAK